MNNSNKMTTDRKKEVILIVEDEATLASIITDTLEDEGFAVVKAKDGDEGLKRFFEIKPDLLVADVMMPKTDGFEMVRQIRGMDKTTPVLFLTARSSTEDLVTGFELGANDYLRKPFKMQELIVRIKSLLNRAIKAKTADTVFHIGHYVFDAVAQTLTNAGVMHELSHLENEVLKRLSLNINNIVNVKSLLIDLWFDDSPYNRNSLHGYIHKLRKLLSGDE
ncbi:MAG: response regulator transcription factor, partial [Tannerella sp.]|nr:response regulator transcription factor [Tannerella sp.]